MHSRLLAFSELAIAMGLLVPTALAQKPAPAPPPSNPTPKSPSAPLNPAPSSSPVDERVLYVTGQIITDDGSPIPHDLVVERVCNGSVRQQVHASPRGDFSMQMGSMADTFLDASSSGDPMRDRNSQYGATDRPSQYGTQTGIPRRDLLNCELRASGSGSRSTVANLVEFLIVPVNFGDLTVSKGRDDIRLQVIDVGVCAAIFDGWHHYLISISRKVPRRLPGSQAFDS